MKFRKKPVVIEAMQFTVENKDQVRNWVETGTRTLAQGTSENPRLGIRTLEGMMEANVGDWIIRGVKGEFYPCKPDIFSETYEPAE